MAWNSEVYAKALPSERPTRTHLALLFQYVVLLLAAELLLAFAGLSGQGALALAGFLIDVFLIVSLPLEAAFLATKDRPLAALLVALVLPPLLRVVSLSTPVAPFTTVQWLAIVGVPLLLAAAAMMQTLGLRPRDVFLALGERRYLIVNVTLVALGFVLGFLEYQVLRPSPWVKGAGGGDFAFAGLAIFFTTGLAEELIFRGVLLSTSVRFMGRRAGLVYVTVVFAILHVGFLSAPELLLIFVMGLLFGAVVLVTKTLWGAVGAATLANVALYLIFPVGL